MYNFGKLSSRPVFHQVVNEDGTKGEPIKFLGFFNEAGTLWHHLYKQHEHPFYIAVDDNGRVVSLEREAEQSQIDGFEIIGIDDNYGVTPGSEGGLFSNKVWNGKEIIDNPVLRSIQKWQFDAALQIASETDKKDYKAKLETAISKLDVMERAVFSHKLISAPYLNYADPLTDVIQKAMGKSKKQFDIFWKSAIDLA